jgi:hypothetical protein
LTHFWSLLSWMTWGITGRPHVTPLPWVYWHARLMVGAWTICFPLAALIARFFKVLPRQDWPRQRDHKLWWHCHRSLVSLGAPLTLLALLIAYVNGIAYTTIQTIHTVTGFSIVALLCLQIASGLVRGTKGGPTHTTLRGDHYDMSPRRILFEYVHKNLGWIVIWLATAETYLGLWMVNAPRWMVLVISLWWLLFLVGFARLQTGGRCIDTYQAIWGPDPIHPGNRRRPIGWGIRPHPNHHKIGASERHAESRDDR